MVHYPPTPQPAWMRGIAPRPPAAPAFTFRPLSRGTFVTRHTHGHAVSVTEVLWDQGRALILHTPLHEDLDGAPDSYAPPISATNLRPRNGVQVSETSLKNATNESDPNPVFHDPPLNALGQPPRDPVTGEDLNPRNSFEWTGVVSRRNFGPNPNNLQIDDRLFLQDSRRRFPVMSTDPAFPDHYAPQTATVDQNGRAVNPFTVPYAVLSASLRDNGGVSIGDFGLAIRPSTGDSSPLVYGDAGGRRSTSVGEASRHLIRTLFGGAATDEAVCYLIFPDSAPSRVIDTRTIAAHVTRLVAALDRLSNVDELVEKMAGAMPGALFASFMPRILVTLERERLRQVQQRMRRALEANGLPHH